MSNIHNEIELLASQFTANSQPATEKDFEIFIEKIKQFGVSNPAIPDELKALWNVASEWHLIKRHYNVYGFNIYGPLEVVLRTSNVFGDTDVRRQWVSDHGEDSCGDADWLCLAGYTEYDYIFMNFNRQSEKFGATRHMVNNQDTEEEYTKPPFDIKFIEKIKTQIEKFKEELEEAEEEEEED